MRLELSDNSQFDRNQKNGFFVRGPLSLKAYIYLKLIASIDDKIELKILEDNDNE